MAAFNQHHQQHSFNSNSNSSSSSSSTTSSSHHHVHHPSLPTQTTPQAAAAAPVSRTSPQSHNEPSLLPETIGKRVDPQYSQVLHARVKDILRIHYDSFPGSQPVSFETKHLTELEQEDYFVCEKTDGVRYLLFFCHSSKGPASFLFDRNRIWYYVPNLLFPMRGREKEFLKDTLMDGELVIDTEPNDKKVWRFLLFDLMSLNGVPVTKRSFNTRLGMLQQEVIAPFKNSVRHIADALKSPPFSIELKKMERSYGLHLVFDQMAKLKHSSDGVIWTPVKHPYVPGTCDKLLKWKPPELNTVDFRIFAKWSKEHKPIYNLEVLSHGVTYKFFDHFQPEHELASQWKSHLPDGRIAEFRYDPDWKVTVVEQGCTLHRFVRFRTDKDTANDENVVQKIMHSIQDGITKDQLLAHMDKVRSAWKAR
ncbi:mRNA capping enzyme, catalytic domain-containing protein, partial [Zychaea mexicana]|uniref:mRNA capping enzyme, catalytic domain-containing protein n=1 Tax=Zychaea mexicana TaxID=64656 RepID=UPI0022FDDD60